MQLPAGPEIGDEWSLWVQYWAEAAVRPELRAAHDRLYSQWRDAIVRIIVQGQRSGAFRADVNPIEVARHLTALTDGAGIQALLGVSGSDPGAMRRLLAAYVDAELTR